MSDAEKLSSAGKLLSAMGFETSDLALAEYYNNGRHHLSHYRAGHEPLGKTGVAARRRYHSVIE